jgi:hypothetical protein
MNLVLDEVGIEFTKVIRSYDEFNMKLNIIDLQKYQQNKNELLYNIYMYVDDEPNKILLANCNIEYFYDLYFSTDEVQIIIDNYTNNLRTLKINKLYYDKN